MDIDGIYGSLDEALAEGVVPEGFGEPPPDIDSMYDGDDAAARDHVNRVLRALGTVSDQRAIVNHAYDAELERLQGWRDRRLEVADNAETWFTAQIEGWLRSHFTDTGTQTVSLPNGKVKLTKKRARVDLHPELAKADGHVMADTLEGAGSGDLVRHKYELAKADAMKVVKPGELLVDQVDVPEGYEARHAVRSDGGVVPGLVMFTPVAGHEGYTFGVSVAVDL